jgi:hypothetical protein
MSSTFWLDLAFYSNLSLMLIVNFDFVQLQVFFTFYSASFLISSFLQLPTGHSKAYVHSVSIWFLLLLVFNFICYNLVRIKKLF